MFIRGNLISSIPSGYNETRYNYLIGGIDLIVGLDMGGTHIDGVIIKDGQIINRIKKPSDRDNLFESIWTSLEELLADYKKEDIKRINLSTTISTNAIVEDKTSSVGMIIQSGPGLSNEFLKCGDENVFISGYVDHRGIEVEALDGEEISQALDLFRGSGLESCAVVTKFSTRNPENEIRIGQSLAREFKTPTLGHRMSGKLNFPRRVFTSYLNSAIQSNFHSFASSIKKSLVREGIDAPLFILKADGGTMTIDEAEMKPVESILSGPAASFMGISALLDLKEDSILLDIGGTTTDIFFLADGRVLFEPLGIQIGSYKTLIRSIYSVSIGLGGDSSIRVKDGELIIGPNREGKPYCLGGLVATPTDALVYLNLIDIREREAKNRAEEIILDLSKELDRSPQDTAHLILEVMTSTIKDKTEDLLEQINSKPVYTVKDLLHGKKLEPKSIHLIGGPAKALAPSLEKAYSLPTYLAKDYHIANAIGAALARPTRSITVMADTEKRRLSIPEMGIYEKIPKDFTIVDARNKALDHLKDYALSIDPSDKKVETEIIEESSFNMVRGFSTRGKNIRIRAQIKPGHILRLGGVDSDQG